MIQSLWVVILPILSFLCNILKKAKQLGQKTYQCLPGDSDGSEIGNWLGRRLTTKTYFITFYSDKNLLYLDCVIVSGLYVKIKINIYLSCLISIKEGKFIYMKLINNNYIQNWFLTWSAYIWKFFKTYRQKYMWILCVYVCVCNITQILQTIKDGGRKNKIWIN